MLPTPADTDVVMPDISPGGRTASSTEELPQRPEEIMVRDGHLDRADVVAIQRAVMERDRLLKINDRIQYFTVKSPETVEVNTLSVSTSGSEGGYLVVLKKTKGGWIISGSGSWIGDKMPPELPPGY